MGEFAVGGVLFSSMLAAVLIALVAGFGLRRVLTLFGAYRFIWHPALFDTALFVILWALVVALFSRLSL